MKSILLMTRKIIYIILFLNNALLFSQTNFKLYYQKKGDTITLLMDNNDAYPYSFEFFGQPKVENMSSIGEHFNNWYLIEGNTTKLRLAQFVPLDVNKPFAFKQIPRFRVNVGNVLKTDYDKDYVYDLPYNKGKNFNVIQGYNGDYSHRNQYAIDFNMPEGTEVLAARKGIVVQIKDNSNINCPNEACASEGNYIEIIHPDGTIADYYHIRLNGSKVKIGDKIEKGQVIALSGNTGYSNGPHLHFVCYSFANKKRKTIKTLFRTGNGDNIKYLLQGNTYRKNY